MSDDRKLLADPNAWYISDAERVELLRVEVDALRADAERFRWLAAQTHMQIVTDGTVWHHGGGRESFVGWGYMYVNGRGYPAAPSLAELVDLARADQGDLR